ncbi:hypothetical protein HK097_001187 [Rhizophlyctis rosea]|uniref:Uncharacterized protein n=1 Tax=Rhizophlyctis rosea TaxID=64517 RepID=A0AAD5S713_9FUNG|nr:hypothetical protein HK097_001187 [Rhizophlyctis rosea]
MSRDRVDASMDEYGHPISLAAYSNSPQFSTSMQSLYGTDFLIDAKPQGASFRDEPGQEVRNSQKSGGVGVGEKDERVVRFADSVAEGYKASDAPTAAMSYNEGLRRANALNAAEGAGHDRV